jgi:hypothetical protein
MRNKTAGKIGPFYFTPGEAHSLQEALRVSSMVFDAQEPEAGDTLRELSLEAAAYTEQRRTRMTSIGQRIGKATSAHIRGKLSGSRTRATRGRARGRK